MRCIRAIALGALIGASLMLGACGGNAQSGVWVDSTRDACCIATGGNPSVTIVNRGPGAATVLEVTAGEPGNPPTLIAIGPGNSRTVTGPKRVEVRVVQASGCYIDFNCEGITGVEVSASPKPAAK